MQLKKDLEDKSGKLLVLRLCLPADKGGRAESRWEEPEI